MTVAEKMKIKSLTMDGVPTASIASEMFYHVNAIRYQQRKMTLYKPKDYCEEQRQ